MNLDQIRTRLLVVLERILGERPTTEHLLLLGLLTGSLYMFWEAQSFASASRRFPQLTAGTAAVLSSILLARNYLPEPLSRLLLTDTESDSASTQTAQYTYELDEYRGPAVIIGLCTIYVGVASLIGLLYATPLFVLLYCVWAEMSAPRAGLLVMLSFGTALGFYLVVSPSIGVGWLTNWEPPVPLPSMTVGRVSWL